MTTPENGRAGLKSCDPDTDLALKNTSAAVPMKQTPAVDLDEEFLARVVPWPTTEAPGYINLHWFRPDKPDGTKGRMSGAPHTQIADFMGLARWGVTKPSIMTDIFFCLSLQSRVGNVKQNGKYRAHREAKCALALKAIWLDIDVKPGKGYATKKEAATALAQFLADAELPPPSAVVTSGGGFHVYWFSHRPLPVDEWRPYAEGLKNLAIIHRLKCDPGVTTDQARILRLPGTYNYKTQPPLPCRIMGGRLGNDYDFDAVLAFRAKPEPRVAGLLPSTVTRPVTLLYDPGDFPAKPIPPDGFGESLADGITKDYDDTPLSADGLWANCPHFYDAAKTHGADYPQGLWMLDVLTCTFLDGGQKLAHYMSKGYADYSRAETNAMYDRKLKEREEKGLGWPSCQAFEDQGCALCKNCSRRGTVRSPLNFAERIVPDCADSTGQNVQDSSAHPTRALMALHKRAKPKEVLFAALNKNYAVVRYGSDVLIASIIADDIFFMKVEDFHKMFGNVRVRQGLDLVEVSRAWLKWSGRRQYFGRGVAFEPGGPLEVADDMINLWRGFGISPKQGNWALLRRHIFDVVCSGQQQYFDYLIKWMAYTVQYPDRPIGVAIALRGPQGAGKGVVARTFGKIFGKHFSHVAHGEQLTGRFNASVATSCVVFLDEALWAGDKKAEGVLKALITEPCLQLEAKFKDPIMVPNRLHIIVASNNDWVVPAGIGDRRWFALDVADTFAGMGHKAYWEALYGEIDNGGAAALFHELLATDLTGFDVRAVPHTAAKAQQQVHSLHGVDAWLYHILQEGAIGGEHWQANGLTISKDQAYDCFMDFSKRQHAWRPEIKDLWSKNIRKALGTNVRDTRPGKVRSLEFAPLAVCRRKFAGHVVAPDIEWDAESDPATGHLPLTAPEEGLGDQASSDLAPTLTVT